MRRDEAGPRFVAFKHNTKDCCFCLLVVQSTGNTLVYLRDRNKGTLTEYRVAGVKIDIVCS